MIVPSGKGFNFNELTRGMAKVRHDIKVVAGKNAVNQFKGNFRKQGFEDSTVDPWQRRKKSDSRRRVGRAILVDTGHLRSNIRVLGMPQNSVIIGTRGIRYARRHNEGLAKMPKRQFIGNSRVLEMRNAKMIQNRLNKHFNKR